MGRLVMVGAMGLAVLLLVGCGNATPSTTQAVSTGATVASNPPTTVQDTTPTSATPETTAAPDTSDDVKAVKKAVRAYSEAFLGGDAKKAWLMRSPAAQQTISYVEFAAAVEQATRFYGEAEMTSLEVTVVADTASATYTYDLSDIDQTDQRWIRQGDTWLLDF